MKISGSLKRSVLYTELFAFLKSVDSGAEKEVLFSKIFYTKRKFRADFYCPVLKLIIEVNGGQFVSGRHNRGGKGYETDLTKLNLAQSNGLTVFQFTYQMLEKQEYKEPIMNYIRNKDESLPNQRREQDFKGKT